LAGSAARKAWHLFRSCPRTTVARRQRSGMGGPGCRRLTFGASDGQSAEPGVTRVKLTALGSDEQSGFIGSKRGCLNARQSHPSTNAEATFRKARDLERGWNGFGSVGGHPQGTRERTTPGRHQAAHNGYVVELAGSSPRRPGASGVRGGSQGLMLVPRQRDS
jgi:hypothetical protein